MKCPKCSYISFDFNLVCPKCSKDISVEQSKLNLPNFRPAPLALLGALIGDTNESGVRLGIGQTGGLGRAVEPETLSLQGSGALTAEELSLDEGEKMDFSLEVERPEELEGLGQRPLGHERLSEPAGLADISASVTEVPPSDISPKKDLEDLSLDQDFLSLEELELEPIAEEVEDEISLGLEDISLEETSRPGPAPEEEAGETALELEKISLQDPELEEALTAEPGIEKAGDEPMLELDEISLEEAEDKGGKPAERLAGTGEDFGVEMEIPELGMALEEVSIEKDEIELNLDDLEINDTKALEIQPSATGLDEATIDIDDLLGEQTTAEEARSKAMAKPDEEGDLDLESLILEDEEVSKSADTWEKELLDLENIDLELDLEEPDQKSP